jgi:hypothetical protein
MIKEAYHEGSLRFVRPDELGNDQCVGLGGTGIWQRGPGPVPLQGLLFAGRDAALPGPEAAALIGPVLGNPAAVSDVQGYLDVNSVVSLAGGCGTRCTRWRGRPSVPSSQRRSPPTGGRLASP